MTGNRMSANKRLVFLSVIRNKSFRSLWFAQMCSQIASNTLIFVLALHVYAITGANAAVSGLFLVWGVPAVLFGVIGGAIVDKLDKRTVLILCDIVRAFVSFVFFLFPDSVVLIYVLTFLTAIITQLYIPAEAPTIPYLVSKDQLMSANSLFSFTYFSSLALGSIFAGPLLKIFSLRGVYAVIASFFLFGAYNAQMIPTFREKIDSYRILFAHSIEYLFGRIIANIRFALSYVVDTPELKQALILLMGTQVILAMLGTLGPGFADRVLQIDIRDSSIIIMGPAVAGIVLGALWVGNSGDKISRGLLIRIGVMAAGILLMSIAALVRLSRVGIISYFFPPWIMLGISVLLFFLLGVSNSFLDVPANSVLQEKAQENVRGKIYGMLAAAVGGLGILPVIVGGVLADLFGVGRVIFILGCLITLYGMWCIRYTKL